MCIYSAYREDLEALLKSNNKTLIFKVYKKPVLSTEHSRSFHLCPNEIQKFDMSTHY